MTDEHVEIEATNGKVIPVVLSRRRRWLWIVGGLLLSAAAVTFATAIIGNGHTAATANKAAHQAKRASKIAQGLARSAQEQQSFGTRLICRMFENQVLADGLPPAALADTDRYLVQLKCKASLSAPHGQLPTPAGVGPSRRPAGQPPQQQPPPPGTRPTSAPPTRPVRTPPPRTSKPPKPPTSKPPKPPKSRRPSSPPPVKVCATVGPLGGCLHG